MSLRISVMRSVVRNLAFEEKEDFSHELDELCWSKLGIDFPEPRLLQLVSIEHKG